jgi:hypothetical protein
LPETYDYECFPDECSSDNEASLDFVDDATNGFQNLLTQDTADLTSDGRVY